MIPRGVVSKKALQLLEKKHDIEILSKSEFLNRL